MEIEERVHWKFLCVPGSDFSKSNNTFTCDQRRNERQHNFNLDSILIQSSQSGISSLFDNTDISCKCPLYSTTERTLESKLSKSSSHPSSSPQPSLPCFPATSATFEAFSTSNRSLQQHQRTEFDTLANDLNSSFSTPCPDSRSPSPISIE